MASGRHRERSLLEELPMPWTDRQWHVWVGVLAVQAHALTDSMGGALEGGNQALCGRSAGLFLYLPEDGDSYTAQACNWAL